jgi:hypothetical protein
MLSSVTSSGSNLVGVTTGGLADPAVGSIPAHVEAHLRGWKPDPTLHRLTQGSRSPSICLLREVSRVMIV